MSQDATDKSPQRGRPSQGKSGAFKFRVTASLREKLEDEAANIDRPVSEVIEARLIASFEEDERAAKENLAARRMGRVLMRVWQDFDEIFGPEWADHESGRAAMQFALMEAIRFGVPVKRVDELTEGDKAEIAQLQEAVAPIVNAATLRFFDPKAAYLNNKLLAAALGRPSTFIDTHNASRKAR